MPALPPESCVFGTCNMLPGLGDTLVATAPFLGSDDVGALSTTATAVRILLAPATRLVFHAREAAEKLHAMSCVSFAFALAPLDPRALWRAVETLSELRMLRRREYVATETGMAPTEVIPWQFPSAADLFAAVALVETFAVSKDGTCQQPGLLFGAVLSMAETAQSTRTLAAATCPLGFEWVDGHATDNLQLGFQVFIPGPGQDVPVHVEIDVELVSGGWADWAEDWSIHESTLGAAVDVGVLLPNCTAGACIITLSQPLGQKHAELQPLHLAEDLFRALRAPEGLVAVVRVSKLRWQKPAPPWFPAEMERIISLPA